jgi:ligand-binding SRPBCC domain-containing protein
VPPLHFQAELIVPAPLVDVFAFFADARNLERLTPPWLRFHIVTRAPIIMQPGTIIDYRLRIHGVPAGWRSEITVWEPPERFVDEQRRGPYRRWVHTHTFKSAPGGTAVTDAVEYDVPVRWLTAGFVRRDIETIFAYRMQALREHFRAPGHI